MDKIRKCMNCKEYRESYFCGYTSAYCEIFGSLDMDQTERHPDTTGEKCPKWKEKVKNE